MNGDGDSESWLNGWEQQCADEIEEQPDYEQSLITESDNSHRKIWTAFQDSATAIAQLYRGNLQWQGRFLRVFDRGRPVCNRHFVLTCYIDQLSCLC